MNARLLLVTLGLLLCATASRAEYLILAGGPALRSWEDLRVPDDQHDRWWANFIRASTILMDQVRAEPNGAQVPITWIVHRRSYERRAREDGNPYITWITGQAEKRDVRLIWVNTTDEVIRAINSQPRGSVRHFHFFGHSNRHAFMLDYGNDIMAASTAWLHERDLPRINRAIFARGAECKSWGCHTGESMTQVWRRTLGVPLEGARGKTLYTVVGQGELPLGFGGWVR